MENNEEEKRYPGVRPKPDEELKWRRKCTPPESNLLFREKGTGIPRRLEAVFIALGDGRTTTSKVLTRESLDEHPKTKDLPKQEKDLIYQYWPHWNTQVEEVKALANLRNDMINEASKASKVAGIIARREEFDDLTLPEQLRVTAMTLDKQFQHAALIIAATSIEDLTSSASPELAKELFDKRMSYAKSVYWLREKAIDLSQRIEEKALDDFTHGREEKELNSILNEVNALVARRKSL